MVAGPSAAGDPGIGGGGGGVTVGALMGTVGALTGAATEGGGGTNITGGIGGTDVAVVPAVPTPVASSSESGIRNVSPTKIRFGLVMRLTSASSSTVTP